VFCCLGSVLNLNGFVLKVVEDDPLLWMFIDVGDEVMRSLLVGLVFMDVDRFRPVFIGNIGC
jgi:hypothetical protein